MFRRILLAALVAPLLALAPPGGPGAAAHATMAADEGAVVRPEWGRIKGERGVLKKGCRKYHYTYSITPPEGDWALEVFISGPDIEHLASGAYDGAFDPTTGRGTYTLCFVTTRYGRFTIEAKLSVMNGPEGYVEGWLPKSHFRLHRPHRHR